MESTVVVTSQDVVKDKVITLVSPKHPFPQETMFLSNIDQAVSFPVETLFFFNVQEDKKSSTSDITERIKKATSELLIPYYFMSGRLSFNSETKRLELICNNAGISFVSGTSRLALTDLGNLSLPNPTFGHFLHRPGLYKNLAETTLLTIQVSSYINFVNC